MIRLAVFALIMLACRAAGAADAPKDGPSVKVVVPEPLTPVSGIASALKLDTAGKVQGREVVFERLLADTPYDLSITLKDGRVLQGVDMSWYNEESAKTDKPFTEDDLKQITSLMKDIKSFYDHTDCLRLIGNHDRAVALVQLVRDSDFHAGKGNVIWRLELWYLKNQFGGWEKVQQQNKVLRRERYKSPAAFGEATKHLRYVPELGGFG